jgi:hypothetical protein
VFIFFVGCVLGCAGVQMCVCLFQDTRVCVYVFVYFKTKANYLYKRMTKHWFTFMPNDVNFV